jgi:hypothetical protein
MIFALAAARGQDQSGVDRNDGVDWRDPRSNSELAKHPSRLQPLPGFVTVGRCRDIARTRFRFVALALDFPRPSECWLTIHRSPERASG